VEEQSYHLVHQVLVFQAVLVDQMLNLAVVAGVVTVLTDLLVAVVAVKVALMQPMVKQEPQPLALVAVAVVVQTEVLLLVLAVVVLVDM
jgi:hypothetical protein